MSHLRPAGTFPQDEGMKGLTQKQSAFVLEFFKDCNATQACIRAGYRPKGARVQGTRLLTNPNIQAELAKIREQTRSAAIMEHNEACEILTHIARAKLTDFDGDNERIDIKAGNGHALAEATQKRGPVGATILKIKLHDPIRAIERLAKLRGWDKPEEHAHTVVFKDAKHHEGI